MSFNFSANQYEQAFDPKRSGKWELRNWRGRYPTRREGFSTFHANDRGHLLPNVPRRLQSPWGNFVGTWDLPLKIPGNRQLSPTARRHDAHLRLQDMALDAAEVMCGGHKKIKALQTMPVRITDEEEHEVPAYNNIANPAMKTPVARTEELLAISRMITPPKLPMSHEVNWEQYRYPGTTLMEDSLAVPRPQPHDGQDIPAEEFHVASPLDFDPSVATGAVDSLQENYIEDAGGEVAETGDA